MTQKFGETHVMLLKKHLQALVEVELFTVPFYLTAVYSFTETALNYNPNPNQQPPLAALQQETLSVAVQEMYHLQMACNIANSFRMTPKIPKLEMLANETLTVPHLEEGQQPLQTQLGNLPAVIDAMMLVERPNPKKKFPPPNDAVIYPSIADLYHATLALLKDYLQAYPKADPNFQADHNQVVYGAFETRYKYNKIKIPNDVKEGANAVADQGEGNLVAAEDLARFFEFGEEGRVLLRYQASKGSRFYLYDQLTHYKRFTDIHDTLKSQNWDNVICAPAVCPTFYQVGSQSPDLPAWAADVTTLQETLKTIWSYLLDLMQSGFQTGKLSPENPTDPTLPGFNDAMLSFKYVIPLIWQWGQCPSFAYKPGVTAKDVQAAMDVADPLCLFHWDRKTALIRNDPSKQKNACEGLNMCAGQGWGGIATEKGNGACATADLHSCQGGNSCSLQGGCGFLSPSLPATSQWVPGENQGAKSGGCQTPIATRQVFDKTATFDQFPSSPAKERLEQLQQNHVTVWDEARNLLAKQLNVPVNELPTPQTASEGGIDYDGNKRRTAITPTSS